MRQDGGTGDLSTHAIEEGEADSTGEFEIILCFQFVMSTERDLPGRAGGVDALPSTATWCWPAGGPAPAGTGTARRLRRRQTPAGGDLEVWGGEVRAERKQVSEDME